MDQIADRFAGFEEIITSEEDFREFVGHAKERIKAKVIDHLSDICQDFIARSPFVVVGSSDNTGRCEVSPKGDPIGFVKVLDEKHLVIPERPGNKLAATFSNLVENPFVGLMFLVPGKGETLRVTGEARIVRDRHIREDLVVNGKVPELAVVVYVEHAEIHCPKCMIRSDLWDPESWPESKDLPTVSEASKQHGNLDYTPEEQKAFAEQEGLNRLY